MKLCSRCVLPDTVPGSDFDEQGICRFCRMLPTQEERRARKDRLQARFEDLVRQVSRRQGYHCLVAWSGGKDSTYTLWLLKEKYRLRVLAFSLDNGFASTATHKNLRTVAESLGVDHVSVKPRFDLLRQVFVASMQPGLYPPRALLRASGICNSCMALAKGIALRIAIPQGIPMLAFGWSPGQVPPAASFFRTNPKMLRAMIQAAVSPLEGVADGEIRTYFPQEAEIEKAQEFPYQVSPLAFLDYNEELIHRRLRMLGWERPRDTDPNSSNCLLNSFANVVHVEQMGYHPYAMELSALVREGVISREAAIARLEDLAAPQVLAAVEAKLGVRAVGDHVPAT